MNLERRSIDRARSADEDPRDAFVRRKAAEFARLAPRFELVSWLYACGRLRRLRRATAELAGVGDAASQVLDLCCGTGGVTRELLRLFPRVTGIDLSPDMLAVARRRCRADLARVRFVQAEVSGVTLTSGSFDAAVVAFGLHEMPAGVRTEVLERARGWLRPGAPLVISDYCWPGNRLLRRMFGRFAPALVEPQLLRGWLDWPLDEILEDMGFARVHDEFWYGGAVRIAAWRAPAAVAGRPLLAARFGPAPGTPTEGG
jgi:ubiquinone/menaquinone biosynthesis C-methylase UbiE